MRKWIACCAMVLAIVVVLACVGLRIHAVNDAAIAVPKETYAMGDKVDMEESFMTTHNEHTDGYSVTVDKAEKMSYSDYIEQYGTDKAKKERAKGKSVDGADTVSVVVLEMTIQNTRKDADGFLASGEWRLVPERANTYYIVGDSLWAESEANAPGAGGVLALLPQSSYTTHIPFVTNTGEEEIYMHEIVDTKFKLWVADAPVSKTISIEAE